VTPRPAEVSRDVDAEELTRTVATTDRGLTEAEAAGRLAARGPLREPPSSRSYASIVRANVLTVFNLILLVFGVLTLAFGAWQDALFLGILVFNSAIGIVQEIRAKLALDRLSALVAARATVVRDGQPRRLAVEQVVVGDLVALGPGDQLVADGALASADGLLLDESILTGESSPVARRPGDKVRSGSFVAEGAGTYEVAAVGPDSYAAQVTGVARAFRHPRSPLERALNRLLFVLVGLIVPLGALSGYALWERQTQLSTAVTTAVAEVVTLVPEGLILLASLTFAVSALRMARRGALAQQLNATESLASVDVICFDKTGTLTEPRLQVLELVPAPGTAPDSLARALARYAAAAPSRNATLSAIAEAYPSAPETPALQVPFSSARRWGAAAFDGRLFVLGAPELFPLGELADEAALEAAKGRRVVAFGSGKVPPDTEHVPPDLSLQGLVVLAERLRPQARETVEFLQSQGVELKVLSGDRPETVDAIALDVGIRGAGQPLSGDNLPTDPSALRELLGQKAVVGRISPEGKRRIVEALRDGGRYVAMIGDGVNDVPALKASRLAIAQGSGTQMAKSVADVVLVNGDFGAVPAMVAEGRQLLRNLQRVSKLFLTKSAFAMFLILSIGLTPTAYPLLPRHLTLAASVTIGIPAFFLALAPSSGPFRPVGFLREVARFAVPAGTAAGLGVLAAYLFALNVVNLPLIEARTVAVTVLVVIGLYLIVALEASGGRRSAAVVSLSVAMAAVYAGVMLLPWSRHFFQLSPPSPTIFMIAATGALIAIGGLWLTDDRYAVRIRGHGS
jgi:cation-transporting ATPase E